MNNGRPSRNNSAITQLEGRGGKGEEGGERREGRGGRGEEGGERREEGDYEWNKTRARKVNMFFIRRIKYIKFYKHRFLHTCTHKHTDSYTPIITGPQLLP